MLILILLIGLMAGGCLGLFVAAICSASGRADDIACCNYKDHMIEQLAEALVDTRVKMKEAQDGIARE